MILSTTFITDDFFMNRSGRHSPRAFRRDTANRSHATALTAGDVHIESRDRQSKAQWATARV